ncbi:MAG: glycosyltransferase family 39 protein [Holophagae bacterium]|jgi:4-amino-4-deoxy-L-arabinose transferase-like glycosyltransferase
MDRGEIVLCVLLTVSALLFISSAIVSIQKRPHGSADAISIWNGRARILYRAGNNAEEVFRKLKHGHPDYPLFLSGTIAGQFQMAGHESPRIPQSISVVLATACVGAAALALLCWAGRKSALIGCSILLVTPAFNKWSVSQNSDIPLAYVAVLALLALSCAADRQPGQIDRTVLLLTGFLVGLLVWIKDEGIVLACALLGGALIVLVFDRERKQRWRCVAWMIPGLAVPVLTTAVFKISWVTTSQIVQVAEGNALENFIAWDRWSSVAKAFLTEFSPIHEARAWGFAWLAMGLLAAWRWRSLWSGSTQRLATATVVLAWIGYFTIYLLTPQPLDWHLRTSVQRLFLQLFPLSIAWIGALFGQGGSRSC